MPKNCLGTRHRRQANLLILSNPGQQVCESVPRATPRQVSDEDIQMNSAISSSSSCNSSSCLDASTHSKRSLKRAKPTSCLVDMVVSLTPTSNHRVAETLDGCAVSASPWGHFVDLFMCDDSQVEPCKAASSNRSQALSTSPMRGTVDPYPLPMKRPRLPMSVHDAAIAPKFVLGQKLLPRTSADATELLQDALKDLFV
jgi:hypothetical protein